MYRMCLKIFFSATAIYACIQTETEHLSSQKPLIIKRYKPSIPGIPSQHHTMLILYINPPPFTEIMS